MKKKVKCWKIFKCNKEKCPVYKSKDLSCWLISGTHCRDDIQGKFLEKMEMCIDCEVFKANMDVTAMEGTLKVMNKQFKGFKKIVEERDKEMEDTGIELALGLSEVLDALNKIASGDPGIRISEISENELIAKLKQTVNKTAEGIGTIVDQSHEFAIGLAEHFDILHRVSKGELNARISEISQDELLKALGRVTNQMIESVSRDITEREQAKEKIRIYQEHLASLVRELSSVEERERRRLATDLHELIGQNLAISKIKLGTLRELVFSPSLVAIVDEIRELIEQMIQYARSLTLAISPPILYELGFEAAVKWRSGQIQQQHGILVDFEDDGQPKPLDDEMRILLFKAVCELMINIVKHAQARKAKVSIQRDNDNIRINVEDDGVGFDTSKIDPHNRTIGFGLFNIRERLNSIGGHLTVNSKHGYGTRVTMVAPVKCEKETTRR